MRHSEFKNILWWLCLLVAPLVLVVIELFHPAGFTTSPGMYQYLSKPEPYNPQFKALEYFGPHWWFALHMIQTLMVALVAIGLWNLADLTAASAKLAVLALAWLSRIATFVFLIYYTALDSIGGFGMARAILNTQSLSIQGNGICPTPLTVDQVSGVVCVLNTTWQDPWVGGVGSFISLTGSWAVFFAALFLAVALLLAKKISWIPALLLAAFGWELQESHTMPHGPIAFTLLIIAGIWVWRSTSHPEAA
jgi:hypothetical protein